MIVKLYPGRTEEQKTRLADEFVRSMVEIAKCAEKSVSVAIEEVAPEEWAEKGLPARYPRLRAIALPQTGLRPLQLRKTIPRGIMWYFKWILGVLLACAFGIINAMWMVSEEMLGHEKD